MVLVNRLQDDFHSFLFIFDGFNQTFNLFNFLGQFRVDFYSFVVKLLFALTTLFFNLTESVLFTVLDALFEGVKLLYFLTLKILINSLDLVSVLCEHISENKIILRVPFALLAFERL